MSGKRGHMHTWMEILNPSTSAKPVMTKLQNLFVALVNVKIFQMTQKLRLFRVICEDIFVYADMQNACRCMQCLHHLN